MGLFRKSRHAHLMVGAAVGALTLGANAAYAQTKPITIAPQTLASALHDFGAQTGRQIMFTPETAASKMSRGVDGATDEEVALAQLLQGTGLSWRREANVFIIMKADQDPQGGSAAGRGASTVEALIVTAQKREEDIQDVPIAISAFTQEDLERSQIAGGPDLITQIPNFSFTKTNFSSYSIQIRGIGTQAISATTDPAVAVAFNNTPFIRNRFFEQEFYDLERLEVLRGPQGTLYGRNATAGVVNIISAKPKFYYEAKASADVANYNSTRLEAMINIPLVEDKVALRLAGAWTKRDGYATNEMTGRPIDGRDLWSGRVSLRLEPTDRISANFIYEHFEEDDDRLRSGKQLCMKDPIPATVNGIPTQLGGSVQSTGSYLSQGCERVSLYAPEAFQTPHGFSLPFYSPTAALGNPVFANVDPYLNATQSRDLRVIESSVEPRYRAKVDIAEFQVSIDLSDSLTLTSETAYGADFLWSTQDYNRFTTTPGAFLPNSPQPIPPTLPPGSPSLGSLTDADGVFCDPQLGCSDRLLLVDLSTEQSTQFSQELRLSSDFDGPFNFSLGANYLRHDSEAKYYVFINSLSMLSAFGGATSNLTAAPYVPGVTDNSHCANAGSLVPLTPGLVGDTAPVPDPTLRYNLGFNPCVYIDPNPIESLNDQGRNYFLSRNPYKLVSYAVFGEAYYNLAEDLKLTAGLRWTVDRKTAPQIPSWLLTVRTAGEYPTAKTVFQEWREPSGRLAIDWKPILPFTDQTLLYASYAHGYKAGGANPPPPVLAEWAASARPPTQEFIPDTFGPEFVDAFEVGTKNTLLDGRMTLNLTGFYYDYKGYQVSEIRNRSAVNSNYDAEVWGLELEADWRPLEALRIGIKGGWQNTRIADGETAVDLMDRTAGNEDWIVIRPFPTIPSNCIIPIDVLTATGTIGVGSAGTQFSACVQAYYYGWDPATNLPYVPNPTVHDNNSTGVISPIPASWLGYEGWDPATAPNGGRGFSKDLSGNELPNAPNYTATVTVDYTLPLAGDWLANLRADMHWQSDSWWRVFNDHEYNRLDEFYTVNLAAIFTNPDAGWKVMAYVKNVLDNDALTGAFLNSDDTGLTTNVFLTEPRLYGLRVTKDFTGGGWLGEFGRCAGACPLTVELGGGVGRFGGETADYAPDWLGLYSADFPLPSIQDRDLDWGDMRSVKLTYAPSADWRVAAAYRFGKTNGFAKGSGYEAVPGGYHVSQYIKYSREYVASRDNHFRGAVRDSEEYSIVDFAVGRDFGFGAISPRVGSTLSVGLRHAELESRSHVTLDGIPARVSPPEWRGAFETVICCLPFRTLEAYHTILDSRRGFEGAGPTVTWDGSLRLWGEEEGGHADLDFSLGGGVLFGEQTVYSEEDRWSGYFIMNDGTVRRAIPFEDVIPRSRSKDVTVPNLSLSLGLSYAIDRVKVSTGYAYDRFFDAIDGGYEEAKSFDRTIQGPFLKISVGFGGG